MLCGSVRAAWPRSPTDDGDWVARTDGARHILGEKITGLWNTLAQGDGGGKNWNTEHMDKVMAARRRKQGRRNWGGLPELRRKRRNGRVAAGWVHQ